MWHAFNIHYCRCRKKTRGVWSAGNPGGDKEKHSLMWFVGQTDVEGATVLCSIAWQYAHQLLCCRLEVLE